jgi:hypothetical protein
MKGVLVVMTNAVAGKEDEFTDWYDNVHIPELLQVPGIVAAQRFNAEPSADGQVPPQAFLTLYELDGDVDKVWTAMREAARTPPPDALDRSSITMYGFSAAADRQEG